MEIKRCKSQIGIVHTYGALRTQIMKLNHHQGYGLIWLSQNMWQGLSTIEIKHYKSLDWIGLDLAILVIAVRLIWTLSNQQKRLPQNTYFQRLNPVKKADVT